MTVSLAEGVFGRCLIYTKIFRLMKEMCETTNNCKKLGDEVCMNEAPWKQVANLIFCAGGTMLCYLWFGIIQESM